MTTRPITYLILTITLALTVLLSLLMGLARPVMAAGPCAETGGTPPCFTSIQAAIDAAGSGDTVSVVAGAYTENLIITKSLTLLGGFDDTTLAPRTPRSSIIDGGGVDVVINISNNAVVTIDGFTITGGDGANNAGNGGGIAVDGATVTILNNLIHDNVASSDPVVSGSGGGIFVANSPGPVTISGNTIQSNAAYSVTTGDQFGSGGGIDIESAPSALISNNQIVSNTAAQLATPSTIAGGYGGGIAYYGDSLLLEDNTIQGNVAMTAGNEGYGGGVNIFNTLAITLTNNMIIQNTAIITGNYAGGGGGVSAGGNSGSGRAFTLTGNWVMSNTAAVDLTGAGLFAGGGGVSIFGENSANDSLTMQNNHLIGNVAARSMTGTGSDDTDTASNSEGGGLNVGAITTVAIINNEIWGNTAVETLSLTGAGGWGGAASGGGVFLYGNDTATVNGNDIRDNITARQQIANEVDTDSNGGGLRLGDNQTATVSNNTISGNTAVLAGSLTGNTGQGYYPGGGGVEAACYDRPTCHLSFVGNTLVDNLTAQSLTISGSNADGATDGSMRILQARATLNQNRFLDNRANSQVDPSHTGALWIWESVVTSTNDIFAGNAGGAGASGYNPPPQVKFINDTFYNNGGVGIQSYAPNTTVLVTNTIVFSHELGLEVAQGDGAILISNFNLLNNAINYDPGISSSDQDVIDVDPLFVDAANDDFHLTQASPALNKGTTIGAPALDFEGDSRPQGPGVDIGVDEVRFTSVYLPFIRK